MVLVGLDSVEFVNHGFFSILLESPPSRVPASRKPPDNHAPNVRIVHTCNTHVASFDNRRLFGDYLAGILDKA